MQGAGFCNGITDIDTLAYVWNAAIRPVLTYGINCTHVSKSCLADMEKIQTKLLKTGIGVHKLCRSSPILNAMKVHKIETTLDLSTLNLARSMLCCDSRARSFYIYVMNIHNSGLLRGHGDLFSRVRAICGKHNILFMKFVFNNEYANTVTANVKSAYHQPDGLTESVRMLLHSKDAYDRNLLNLLLKAF